MNICVKTIENLWTHSHQSVCLSVCLSVCAMLHLYLMHCYLYSITDGNRASVSYHLLCSNIQEISWSMLSQISHDFQTGSSLFQAMVFWMPNSLLQVHESLYHSHPVMQGLHQRREMSEKEQRFQVSEVLSVQLRGKVWGRGNLRCHHEICFHSGVNLNSGLCWWLTPFSE
jgi:hypothetical protein